MVAIDFPDAPTTGQVFDKWTWNGSMWVLTTAAVSWVPVVFQNGWSNIGGPYQTMQYRKVGDIVYVRGFIMGGSPGAVVCTLPYAMPAQTRFITMNTGAIGYFEGDPFGQLIHQSGGVGDIVIDFIYSPTT